MWRNEPDDIKAQWKGKAAEERRQHQLRHPNYKYTPRRTESGKKKSEKASEEDEDTKITILQYFDRMNTHDLRMVL